MATGPPLILTSPGPLSPPCLPFHVSTSHRAHLRVLIKVSQTAKQLSSPIAWSYGVALKLPSEALLVKWNLEEQGSQSHSSTVPVCTFDHVGVEIWLQGSLSPHWHVEEEWLLPQVPALCTAHLHAQTPGLTAIHLNARTRSLHIPESPSALFHHALPHQP